MIRRITNLALLPYLAVVYAFPQSSTGSHSHPIGKEPEGHEWMPALKTDSRSPCPGLNSMANHGFLRRSGMDISLAELKAGAQAAYNYTPDTYEIFFNLTTQPAPYFDISTTGTPDFTFNLHDLATHNTIERDGSLSRSDCGANHDDLDFNSTIWDAVAKDLGTYKCDNCKGYISNKTATHAYINRQRMAKKANPVFIDDCFQRNGTQGTTSLYLATLWDYEAQAVPKKWIEPFFVQERIPYLEGYTAPKPKDTDFIHEFVLSINDLVKEIGGLPYFDPATCDFSAGFGDTRVC